MATTVALTADREFLREILPIVSSLKRSTEYLESALIAQIGDDGHAGPPHLSLIEGGGGNDAV